MRKHLALLLVLAAVAAACHGQQRPPNGKVVRVIDGDTIAVMVAGVETRVRLHGIDAPESGQPFGTRAKPELSALVFGKVVVRRYDV